MSPNLFHTVEQAWGVTEHLDAFCLFFVVVFTFFSFSVALLLQLLLSSYGTMC